MPSVDDVIEGYSGMITHEQAKKLLESFSSQAQSDVTNAVGLLEFIGMNRRQQRVEPSSGIFIVNIRDIIYRIFNPIVSQSLGVQTERRSVALGAEGFTVRLNLHGKLSEFMDIAAFERGDTMLARSAFVDIQNGELKDGRSTAIRKIASSTQESVIDYSVLTEGMKNIDVVGKVVELSPIRHVSALSGNSAIPVTDCVLSDLGSTINVSMWESSALAAAKLHANDFVKIEFCSTRMRNGQVEIYANNLSRVLSSRSFAARLRGSG